MTSSVECYTSGVEDDDALKGIWIHFPLFFAEARVMYGKTQKINSLSDLVSWDDIGPTMMISSSAILHHRTKGD